MININYKYTTWALLGILLLAIIFTLCHHSHFGHRSHMMGMHDMKKGGMMMNHEGMTMSDMVNDLKDKTGKELEKAFISGMIPHHQGAVDMAKRLLEDKTISTQLQKFANDIITAQEGEINMMNGLLKGY